MQAKDERRWNPVIKSSDWIPYINECTSRLSSIVFIFLSCIDAKVLNIIFDSCSMYFITHKLSTGKFFYLLFVSKQYQFVQYKSICQIW